MRTVSALLAPPASAAALVYVAPLPDVLTRLGADTHAGGDPAAAAVHVVALAAWVLIAWWAAATATAVATRLPGAGGHAAAVISRRVTPAVVRRALGGGAALGIALSPALAPTGASAADCTPGSLPNLDRAPVACGTPLPTAAPGTTTTPRTPPARRAAQRTIKAGDTLWGLAAEELRAEGMAPTAARVATRWPAWWQANRTVIGADPNLIRVGTVLSVPAPSEESR